MAPPNDRAFWGGVFDSDDAATAVSQSAQGRLVDAAFLVESTGAGDIYSRGDRLDQVSFGQRAFAQVAEGARQDAIATLRALPDHRMLLWSLERIGVTNPLVYVTAARQARNVVVGDPNRVFWALAQFQGALALVARMTEVGTLSRTTAESLIGSLCAVPLENDSRYDGGIARWIQRELLTKMPPGLMVESRLIAGLSGPPASADAPRLMWEGQEYRIDFASAESRRLNAVREKQTGYPLDLSLELMLLSDRLASESVTLQDVRNTGVAITALINSSVPVSNRSESQVIPPGVRAPRPIRESLERIVDDLSKIVRPDPARTRRIAPRLAELSDIVVGEALLSLAYAVDIGDPEGTALLASNVALRHDFGLALRDTDMRVRRAWEVPRQELLPGTPWRVTGSLLGLDIALGRLVLQRINLDRIADPPRMPPNERDALAVGVSLMNPRHHRDEDRARLIASIARGRVKVATLSAPGADTDAVAELIGLDGWRRRALNWSLVNRPSAVPSMFSLAELLTIGAPESDFDIDAWGTMAVYSRGCACTSMLPSGSWAMLSGRPQVALMGSFVADLNLRMAIALYDLGVPAALQRAVLAAAVQDFIYEAAPTDAGDWWALVRSAGDVPKQRVEDYVAAAASIYGPLVPVEGFQPESRP
jgi:hypothetical protein